MIKRGYSEAKTYGIVSFLHNYVRFVRETTVIAGVTVGFVNKVKTTLKAK